MGNGMTKETLSTLTDHLPVLMNYHCAMIGLDYSGKTTVLYRLKYNQYMNAAPTIGFNCEKVRTRFGSSFTVWDVGGQDKLRPLWRSYTRCTDGIIFVVDSCKAERMEEAKLELMRIAKSASHATVPILVLANKQDLPSALETTKLEAVLGLKDLGPHVTWHLQSTCAITGEGLDEGMEKLQEMITRRRRSNMTNFITNGRRKNVSTAQKATRKVKRSHSYHH